MFIKSNEARCTSCHAGYGWKDKTFDFSSERNVDCLVCHEQTGTYEKLPTGAGHPAKEPKRFGGKLYRPPDWNESAQSVARPTRENCGSCHFYGGGGDGVKHGDLDSSLISPSKDLDVHMTSQNGGPDFDCIRCHTTLNHRIDGRCYKVPAAQERKSLLEDDKVSRITCVSCHTKQPHEPGHKANDHTDRVACQSCHIPRYAREKPTKMFWDWSEAGQKGADGSIKVTRGDLGKPVYHTKKGAFRWAKNVVPDYYWFNGTMEYQLINEAFNPSQEPLPINRPVGSRKDGRSLIYPFKVHRSVQPYDKKNHRMVNVHLFGSKESGAYWKTFDWQQAIDAGQEYMGLSWSGELGFIDTAYHFPITHMVAPKEDSLACGACHARVGRLAGLTGFYMPGRDRSGLLDAIGWGLVAASLLGVGIHGAGRAVTSRRRG
jgi:octaheme c-type cytochrome (tetrathionate reductase family)